MLALNSFSENIATPGHLVNGRAPRLQDCKVVPRELKRLPHLVNNPIAANLRGRCLELAMNQLGGGGSTPPPLWPHSTLLYRTAHPQTQILLDGDSHVL